MPNWVINRIKTNAQNFDEFVKKYTSIDEEGNVNFDFNKLVKMSDDLQIEKSSQEMDGIKLYFTSFLNSDIGIKPTSQTVSYEDFAKFIIAVLKNDCLKLKDYLLYKDEINSLKEKYKDSYNDVYELGRKAVLNKIKYGHFDWYDWSLANWGTKWNACNTVIDKDSKTIYFDTAWSPAVPIFKALTEANLDTEFEFTFSEEQIGYCSGRIITKNGEIDSAVLPKPMSKEAYEIAFELWGCEDEYEFS